MKKVMGFISAISFCLLYLPVTADAQQYKIKQVTNVMSMKMESTVYVKGMRKRTEGGGVMGIGGNIATIEQCDLKRIVQLNDKKKLYFIEPFSKGEMEVITDDKPAPAKPSNVSRQKGGVITMWYSIKDTGERKKMHGVTARHIWTSQKIKPSADACTMKDSMLIKTDGWYIDLPQFSCQTDGRPVRNYNEKYDPGCTDRYVMHSSGKGKLGFPLILTTTMIMGNGTEVTTSIETIEFSAAKLDSMLFEIPPGYQLAKSPEELQDKMEVGEMMKAVINNNELNNAAVKTEKRPGTIRIGVFAPTGSNEVQPGQLQMQMVNTLTSNNVDAVAISSMEDAKKYKCDYTLNTVFANIKPATKVGGILKAIKNADPNAAAAYNIQADLTLKNLNDAAVKSQQTVDGKYDGSINNAAGKALTEGSQRLLKTLQ